MGRDVISRRRDVLTIYEEMFSIAYVAAKKEIVAYEWYGLDRHDDG